MDTKDCRVDINAPTFGSDVRTSSLDVSVNDTPMGVKVTKQNKKENPVEGL
jgi:hypothetical protein